MNRISFLIALWVIGYPVSAAQAQEVALNDVRKHFFTIETSDDAAIRLYRMLQNLDLGPEPVLLAYRGASLAASAGSVSGVWRKLEYFKRGRDEIEKAVRLKPLDAEIRFLRMATQLNAPEFLGYSSEIKIDKYHIIKTLQTVTANHPNAYLYRLICSFMISHAKLTQAEEKTVNQLLVKFK